MMLSILTSKIDVAEVYSPPRVASMARKMALSQGWSLDLTTEDTDGRAWDFNHLEMRNRAIRKLLQGKPRLLIGSPMCTAYSCMNNINYARMSKEEVDERVAYARKHLEFCIKLYRIQLNEGRYFLHEHPASAKSWQEKAVTRLLMEEAVEKVVGDQCRYGLTSRKDGVVGPAKKPTGFMTNSVCIARRLAKRCTNTTQRQAHQHIRLESGRAKKAQIFPDKLCNELCEGLMIQMAMDRKGQFLVADYEAETLPASKELMQMAQGMKQQYRTVEEDHDTEMEIAWDDVSGAELNPKEVKKARQEEIQYVRKINLYDKVPIEECYSRGVARDAYWTPLCIELCVLSISR